MLCGCWNMLAFIPRRLEWPKSVVAYSKSMLPTIHFKLNALQHHPSRIRPMCLPLSRHSRSSFHLSHESVNFLRSSLSQRGFSSLTLSTNLQFWFQQALVEIVQHGNSSRLLTRSKSCNSRKCDVACLTLGSFAIFLIPSFRLAQWNGFGESFFQFGAWNGFVRFEHQHVGRISWSGFELGVFWHPGIKDQSWQHDLAWSLGGHCTGSTMLYGGGSIHVRGWWRCCRRLWNMIIGLSWAGCHTRFASRHENIGLFFACPFRDILFPEHS